jgi:hypothetical protein
VWVQAIHFRHKVPLSLWVDESLSLVLLGLQCLQENTDPAKRKTHATCYIPPFTLQAHRFLRGMNMDLHWKRQKMLWEL